MSKRKKKEPALKRYVARLARNARQRPGFRLMHNQVAHQKEWGNGPNGFRCWVARRGWGWDGMVPCPYGWRPDLGKHYAWPFVVKTYRKKTCDEVHREVWGAELRRAKRARDKDRTDHASFNLGRWPERWGPGPASSIEHH